MQNSSKKIVGACALILLCGCQSLMPRSKAPLPVSLTNPCPNLDPLEGKTGADLVRKIVQISEAYYTCADKHKALADSVK